MKSLLALVTFLTAVPAIASPFVGMDDLPAAPSRSIYSVKGVLVDIVATETTCISPDSECLPEGRAVMDFTLEGCLDEMGEVQIQEEMDAENREFRLQITAHAVSRSLLKSQSCALPPTHRVTVPLTAQAIEADRSGLIRVIHTTRNPDYLPFGQ